MDALYLLELAINGAMAGLMYALVAMGVVLIYKSSSVPNLAQGGLTMLGAYMVLAFANSAGLPIWLAIPAAMVTMFLAGMGIERISGGQLICDLPGKVRGQATLHIDLGQFF